MPVLRRLRRDEPLLGSAWRPTCAPCWTSTSSWPSSIGDHILHEQGRRWLEQEVHHGWASCAVTQNGFIRILSQPGYPNPVSTAKAIQLLAAATSTVHHEHWRSEVSILDGTTFDHARIHGPRQLTDVYLVGLAAHHGGRLVTFDQTIALAAVRTASPRNLVVL